MLSAQGLLGAPKLIKPQLESMVRACATECDNGARHMLGR